jgi:hypothetical protein
MIVLPGLPDIDYPYSPFIYNPELEKIQSR